MNGGVILHSLIQKLFDFQFWFMGFEDYSIWELGFEDYSIWYFGFKDNSMLFVFFALIWSTFLFGSFEG